MEKLWCMKHNTMQELMKKTSEELKAHNFGLVPCIKEKCPEWKESWDWKCGHLHRENSTVGRFHPY
jgi:hypothetical protein